MKVRHRTVNLLSKVLGYSFSENPDVPIIRLAQLGVFFIVNNEDDGKIAPNLILLDAFKETAGISRTQAQ